MTARKWQQKEKEAKENGKWHALIVETEINALPVNSRHVPIHLCQLMEPMSLWSPGGPEKLQIYQNPC